MCNRLSSSFFLAEAPEVAEKLLGKILVRYWEDGRISKYCISETEAYLGEEDSACHAHKGRTARTEIMYAEGGFVYVYLIYGMYWMLNFVTGSVNSPQAVLIRGLDNVKGSGRVGKILDINRSFYGENLYLSQRLWVEDAPAIKEFETSTRVGIDYASDEWRLKQWRFILKSHN